MSAAAQTKSANDLIAQHFLSTLGGTFKKVPGSNEEAYFTSLREKLSGFSEEVLKAGADALVLAAKSTVWPFVGECVKACTEAQRQLEGTPEPSLQVGGYPWPEHVAIKIMVGANADTALSACLAGWQADLVDFVRREKRMPDMAETEILVVATMERNRRVAGQVKTALDVLRGETTRELAALPPNHPIQLMADTFERRRERLAGLIAKEVLRHGEMQDVEL
ncbi:MULTISPECIES: hypothetical protein [unclassified Pseudovibrio]|uniref:hypothetical protein n=1 Tax=unclassified Pseudovibrio TaxID=2627060 RepID=UPI0007AE9CFA|nr:MULTISPECIES: hypothetical protein [unclassified Pseudovibrio]KZL00460.1 hypothetical protein PsW74_02885 [Pseudovibrio sp. W74]KZL07460.1 hypothetical protein PsAD14_03845 [Pseudovibrio sp. Ad14]